MLFNSFEFIFAFLPITLAVYFLVARVADRRWAHGWLLLASLFFYGWWNPANLWIIVGSVCFNYWVGTRWIQSAGLDRRRTYLTLGIAANLAVLGYYKYANFFVDNLDALTGGVAATIQGTDEGGNFAWDYAADARPVEAARRTLAPFWESLR